MPSLILTTGIAAVTGSLAGAAAAWFLSHARRESETSLPDDPPDEWAAAEIDRAAVAWAMNQGRPEAATLMADKLHLLHRLGQQRGRADQ